MEVRRFCESRGLIFDEADYDFTPPQPPPKAKGKGRARGFVEVAGGADLLSEGALDVEVGPGPGPAPKAWKGKGRKRTRSSGLRTAGNARDADEFHTHAPPPPPPAGPSSIEEEEAVRTPPSAPLQRHGGKKPTIQVLANILEDIGSGRAEAEEEFIEIQGPPPVDPAPAPGALDDEGPPILDHHPPSEDRDRLRLLHLLFSLTGD